MADSGAASRALRTLHRVEDVFLALLLGAMVVLAPLQILLRSVFDAGFAWGDPLLRALVLWVGLLGALVASRERRHITIDVISRLLAPRPRAVAAAATSLFTAAVSAMVAFHAARFVASDFGFGTVAFSGIPAWVLELVLPFAFGAIALRALLLFAAQLEVLRSNESETR